MGKQSVPGRKYILICGFFFYISLPSMRLLLLLLLLTDTQKMGGGGLKIWRKALTKLFVTIFAISAHDSLQKGMKSILQLLLSLTFLFSLFRAYHLAKDFLYIIDEITEHVMFTCIILFTLK